jgi:hypothetical protein
MKTKIKNIHVNYSEYCYFDYLSDSEAVEYFFQLFEGQFNQPKLDLQDFFSQIQEEEQEDYPIVHLDKELPKNSKRVDVMLDDDYLVVESDSLKAVKLVTGRFMESGYLMTRDKITEKMFKKDKTTRYLRVYSIIGQMPGHCLS